MAQTPRPQGDRILAGHGAGKWVAYAKFAAGKAFIVMSVVCDRMDCPRHVRFSPISDRMATSAVVTQPDILSCPVFHKGVQPAFDAWCFMFLVPERSRWHSPLNDG